MLIFIDISGSARYINRDFFADYDVPSHNCSHVALTTILKEEDAKKLESFRKETNKGASELVDRLSVHWKSKFQAGLSNDERLKIVNNIIEEQIQFIREYLHISGNMFEILFDGNSYGEDTVRILRRSVTSFLFEDVEKTLSLAWCHYANVDEIKAIMWNIDQGF